jgi:ABC-type multidrug transport system fused ATPase/permease subunit
LSTAYIGRKAAHFRNQTTKRTDIRVRLMNEIINGIQVIKMYSWQENFAQVIDKVRKKEMSAVKGSNYILALLYTLWAVARVSLFLTLITYIYSGNVLSARKVFILTAYYNILNMSMVHFWPLAITFCAEGYVSSKRLREFLLMSETKKKPLLFIENKEKDDLKKELLTHNRIHHEISGDSFNSIIFKDVTANWISTDLEITTGLNSINCEFKKGYTYALIGPVGAGKSSFLQAILGELEIDSGSLEIFGSLSYANQEAFLFEGTVRNNILFTEEYDEKKYSKVVAACGLSKDFEQLENGDHTFVGEKGVSLSGGQKARINLARAVYKEADIYLLDDPLSAVDSDVGNTIFYECVINYLKDKTVILVTHQLQYLHQIKDILVLAEGKIKASGSYEELKDKEIARLLPVEKSEAQEKDIDEEFKELTKHINVKKEEEPEIYNEKETQAVGKVRLEVYKKYLKSVQNIPLVIFVLFLRVLNQSIASFIDYFVAQWVNWEESIAQHSNSSVSINDTVISNEDMDGINQKRQQYINIYIGIICVFIFVILNAEFSFFYSLLR